MRMVETIKQELAAFGNPEKAIHLMRFFKTGKGEYGEGDRFLGCTVPETRKVARAHQQAPLSEIERLLTDEMHECRLCALLILAEQFKRGDLFQQKERVDFYLAHTDHINNWDLVDLSAYHILGEWLKTRDRGLLYELAEGGRLWEQRIAVVSTMAFIREGDFADTLKLSERLLYHPHDLIHKACGWMLREVGKRDETVLTAFLDLHVTEMPRTMLRYAIERLSPSQRAYYLKK